MMRRPALIVCLLCVLGAAEAGAQSTPPDSTAAPALDLSSPNVKVDLWPPKLNAYGLVWLPNGTYSERTGLGLGLDTVLPYTIQGDTESLASQLAVSIMGTTENQWRFIFSSDFLWNERRNYAKWHIGYDDLAREFYGIGPEAEKDSKAYYRPRDFKTFAEATWRIGDRTVAVGPRLEYQHHAAGNLEWQGETVPESVFGPTGGAVFGGGLVAIWDRRDRRYQPTAGWFIQTQFMRFAGTNSDVDPFWRFVFDWRVYRQIAPKHTLAWQTYTESVTDGAPYWRLSSLGGQSHSRAYPRDRWLDDVLLSVQGEWRWRALNRFGLVTFAGAAVVDESLAMLRWKYLRPSVGLGLRYFTERGKESVPIRLDLAVGYQHWRVSLGIAEAF